MLSPDVLAHRSKAFRNQNLKLAAVTQGSSAANLERFAGSAEGDGDFFQSSFLITPLPTHPHVISFTMNSRTLSVGCKSYLQKENAPFSCDNKTSFFKLFPLSSSRERRLTMLYYLPSISILV